MAIVEIATRKTRSSVAMSKSDMQKILPGINPLKALQTLPGVSFQTADPWGNNEQNTSLFIHGFSGQQLGYTMDGVPLGDQQYGNYNGLSPQRAVISENVGSVILSSGAGDLSTASTSNLGGTIETFSSDPMQTRNVALQQTVGSYKTSRTFIRYDTGNFGDGNSAYLSGVHQEQKAWDFQGRQGGDQFNAKFVNQSALGKLTLFANYSDKTEPNEDSTVRSATEKYQPYTRPFLYPDFQQALSYLSPTGTTPAADGNNYRNYYGVAQRTDWLTYAKFDMNLGESTTWSNQVYYHNDDGVGIVAGPINVAGLPGLFSVYFPGQNLKQVFGNSGYATRTTEYAINRSGYLSNLTTELGDHKLQASLWLESNRSSAYRRWYAFDVNNPSSPYDRPGNPLITQYGSEIDNKVMQISVQDEWRVRDDLALQAGSNRACSGPTVSSRYSRKSAPSRTVRPPCRSARSPPRNGCCRRSARAGTSPRKTSYSSTCRRTCASSSLMAAAAPRRGAWRTSRRSTCSATPPVRKPRSPMKPACAPATSSTSAA